MFRAQLKLSLKSLLVKTVKFSIEFADILSIKTKSLLDSLDNLLNVANQFFGYCLECVFVFGVNSLFENFDFCIHVLKLD